MQLSMAELSRAETRLDVLKRDGVSAEQIRRALDDEEAKQAMKEASEQHHGHIFSMISNSFSSVFTYVWFYFVTMLTKRP